MSRAWFGGGVLFLAIALAGGQTFQVIHNFAQPGSPFPFGRLVLNSNTLYGINGGYIGGRPDFGSLFQVHTDGGGYSLFKTFSQTYPAGGGIYTNTEGTTPLAGLVLAGDTLYGTAEQGGSAGLGTVFSLKTDGSSFAVVKHFSGSDGKNPYAEVVVDGNVLYGTTAAGGVSNKGTVFRVNTDGSAFTVLKSFNGADGLLPLSGLTLSDGVLYGTTYRGGAAGLGTIFSISTNGTAFTVLKEFTGSDGANPRYNLIVADGVIYGTTEGNGDGSKSLVYRLSTDGSGFAVLKTFSPLDPVSGTNADGYGLRSGLAAAGGTLFGAASQGGNFGSGVIFAVRMDGLTYTVLRHFSATALDNGTNADGAVPFPSLILSQGILYGTTQYGGSMGAGTLFRLDIRPRLEPAVTPAGLALNVTGYSNQVVVIEASSDIARAPWLPLQTNVINLSPVSFLDVTWTNYTRRFYRARLD